MFSENNKIHAIKRIISYNNKIIFVRISIKRIYKYKEIEKITFSSKNNNNFKIIIGQLNEIEEKKISIKSYYIIWPINDAFGGFWSNYVI